MIDIIIPCYNAHATLNRCLASIAMQTMVKDIKVTLVDDCSEQNYHEFVDKWSEFLNIRELNLQVNVGPGGARQMGLDETDGDYVVFVDADDTLATSFSIAQLYRGVLGYDICAGQFIEECENGQFVTHGGDLVWVFAKMYRRNLIDRFLVRFNDSRANEDTGFNTVLSNLTERIHFIPQTVYEWHYAANTITRSNNGAYTWGKGNVGFIQNMEWAVDELRKRNVNHEVIRHLAVDVVCKLYFMHEDVKNAAPWEAEKSLEAIRDFYATAVKPIEREGALPWVYIQESFGKVQHDMMEDERMAGIIMKDTFRTFLKEIGYDSSGNI